jgi:hypothetical protein
VTALRYLLDEHVGPAVASGLQRRGVEALTVQNAGRRGESDDSHMVWAMAQGWVIVTNDRGFLAMAQGMLDHSGLVFCAQRKYDVGGMVRELEGLAHSETLESMRGRVHYL